MSIFFKRTFFFLLFAAAFLYAGLFGGRGVSLRAEGPQFSPEAWDRLSPKEKNLIRSEVQYFTSEIEGVSASEGVVLSWAVADRRVFKAPKIVGYQPASPILIRAPRNDFESFQIVVRPEERNLSGLTASVTDLTGPENGTISKENVEIRYAYYHYVSKPTDATTLPGWYPDALVPLEKGSDGLGAPLEIAAGENQPIYVTVRIPEGVPAGVYSGTLTFGEPGGDFTASVPFSLEVWDFALPAEGRLATAYGLNPDLIFRYHRCGTGEERREIFEKYLKNMSEHRISPYNPIPFTSYVTRWKPEADPPGCEIDFTEFDREYKHVFETYHFNTMMLFIPGMGSGSFFDRHPGKILDFEEGTREYESMFSDFLQKMESHLRELGALDKVYVYWFDEPAEKDYEFVAEGFARLKKSAPGIARMLTEEPSDGFCAVLEQKGTNVDIWCPLSSLYSEEAARKRMAKGERFWWYVCTGLIHPYATEFTDYPAHELRVWLWQAFQRGISGTLIWSANYWTSASAFPDGLQNPYLDPMSYVTGYGTEPGTRSPWGNGDGRLIYPPLAAADAEKGGAYIDDEPVSSLRWEELREGNEDYEMLVMLRDLADEKADRLTAEERAELEKIFDLSSVSSAIDRFADTPDPIYAKRAEVAAAILKLQKK
ncbi:MAG: DUF4091 domain-containing protein [Thermoguttaceae bacterium]|nr:DUF4091 domain-containing protein [Thermoguttaceae bacterium]